MDTIHWKLDYATFSSVQYRSDADGPPLHHQIHEYPPHSQFHRCKLCRAALTGSSSLVGASSRTQFWIFSSLRPPGNTGEHCVHHEELQAVDPHDGVAIGLGNMPIELLSYMMVWSGLQEGVGHCTISSDLCFSPGCRCTEFGCIGSQENSLHIGLGLLVEENHVVQHTKTIHCHEGIGKICCISFGHQARLKLSLPFLSSTQLFLCCSIFALL
jgi:hypothetical protein